MRAPGRPEPQVRTLRAAEIRLRDESQIECRLGRPTLVGASARSGLRDRLRHADGQYIVEAHGDKRDLVEHGLVLRPVEPDGASVTE